MGVPMALRCIKPGAAHLVFNFYRHRPELLRSCLKRCRVQELAAVGGLGEQSWGADFAAWAARNAPLIPGDLEQVGSFLSD